MDELAQDCIASRLGELERTVDRLRRETRRSRRIASAAIVGAAVMVLTGARMAIEVSEANKFVLKGTDGKPLAVLEATKDSTPALTLFDKQAKQRVSLGISPEGAPGLHFFDAEGKHRIALGMTQEGGEGLSLFDSEGRHRAGLGVSPDGSPRLETRDKDGKALFEAPP